jgi:isopentenyldiphosphate isomerase
MSSTNSDDEIFDIFNAETGLKISTRRRASAHRLGLWHQSTNVFLFRKSQEGEVELLLQKRHKNKTVCGDHWDVSCAEHLQPDEPYRVAAARGMYEELGVENFDPAAFIELRSRHAQSNEYKEAKVIDNEFVVTFAAWFAGVCQADNVEVAALAWVNLHCLLEYTNAEIETSVEALTHVQEHCGRDCRFTRWFLQDLPSVREAFTTSQRLFNDDTSGIIPAAN